MQHTESEIGCIIPRMKLRNEVFVFIDGKWVNEIYCQPPFASHQKLLSEKAQNEWSIWEENRALWEENQVLRIKNRMLCEENKALQCLQSQNKAVQVIYTDAIQQGRQKENKLFPFFQERSVGSWVNLGNKALQAVQEKNRVLEDFQQDNEAVHIRWKDPKAVIVNEDSKDASSNLQKDTDAITAMEEVNPGPVPQQEHEAKKRSTTATQNKMKSAPSMQGEYEILRALQDIHELLYTFMDHLLGEKQGCRSLYDMNMSFQEDYSKLKLQLNAMKNTVSDITAQMEMLENEIIAITSSIYGEAGQKLTNEHHLGEM
ncbi:protein chibby homolog 2 [Colius striatus]|uniref:protein chibby homolog 2 n=1 Tax=Colius striatus TaxID=57412 RepID=UPI002B1D7AE0|nr:protein chibby homolog 2 [Colius striatus]XP_061850925.1 protein chibby homolog 2 [Colius striatus]